MEKSQAQSQSRPQPKPPQHPQPEPESPPLTPQQQAKAAKKTNKQNLRAMTRGRRHRTREFRRVVKYGTISFFRNSWLSVAAIAVMIITLLIVSVSLVARTVLDTVVSDIRDQVDMSVYLRQDTTEPEVLDITAALLALTSVKEVKTTSPTEANRAAIEKLIAEQNITDPDVIAAAWEAPNKLPWSLNVKVVDIDDTAELENFVYSDALMQGKLDAKPPSFKSSHRETINNIATVTKTIETVGLIAGAVFAVISMLIIFNTIRMAVFNRREEIYMMKLVGASKSSIRGPFIIEAALYGLLAGLASLGLITLGLMAAEKAWGALLAPTITLAETYWWLLAPALVLTGVLIGTTSALLATKKYLKTR